MTTARATPTRMWKASNQRSNTLRFSHEFKWDRHGAWEILDAKKEKELN